MHPNVDTLADRLAVQDVVVDLLWHVDRRQWQQAKQCLAESVYLDYTSLTGGEPAVVAQNDVEAGWASTLGGFAAPHPDRAVAVELDVTDPACIETVVTEVMRWYRRIDVLVNNAGRGHIGAVEEATDRELRDMMELHFFGPAALTRAVLPHMRRRGSGAIVQTSSLGGRFSFPGVGAYSASKFALEGLSQALAQEVAPLGIKVLIVEPGSFRTGLLGGTMTQSAVVPGYEDTVGRVRSTLGAADGTQPGDPAKAAAAILTALDAEHTPLRLPLGNDAANAVSAHLDSMREEFLTWESVTRGTDFDE